MPQVLTLREKADRFPPIVCRLLARKRVSHDHVVAMTDRDICDRSGLDMATVKGLSWVLSWDSIPFKQMVAFARGCGVDFDDPIQLKANARYIKRGTWSHVLSSPERPYFEALHEHWTRSAGQ